MSNRRVTVHMYVSHRLNESRPPGHRHNTVQYTRHGAGRWCAGPRTGRLGERSADHGALSGIHLAQLRAHVYTCVLNIGIYCYVWCRQYICLASHENKNEKDKKTRALNQAASCSRLLLHAPIPDLHLFRGSSQRETKCQRHTNAP